MLRPYGRGVWYPTLKLVVMKGGYVISDQSGLMRMGYIWDEVFFI